MKQKAEPYSFDIQSMTPKRKKQVFRSLLERAERNELPDQIFDNPEEFEVSIEMVQRGLLDGRITRNGNGQPCNVSGPEITPKGRDYLEALRNVSPLDRVKKHPVVTFLIALGAVLAFLATFTENLARIKNEINALWSTVPTNSLKQPH